MRTSWVQTIALVVIAGALVALAWRAWNPDQSIERAQAGQLEQQRQLVRQMVYANCLTVQLTPPVDRQIARLESPSTCRRP